MKRSVRKKKQKRKDKGYWLYSKKNREGRKRKSEGAKKSRLSLNDLKRKEKD